mmetsp:Transcript_36025/g.107761  ORF Transcript_36025/g.107761 Transcript_36025/m.107761 type:complete len:238 (-) Transcript_36025:787-1500(-)
MFLTAAVVAATAGCRQRWIVHNGVAGLIPRIGGRQRLCVRVLLPHQPSQGPRLLLLLLVLTMLRLARHSGYMLTMLRLDRHSGYIAADRRDSLAHPSSAAAGDAHKILRVRPVCRLSVHLVPLLGLRVLRQRRRARPAAVSLPPILMPVAVPIAALLLRLLRLRRRKPGFPPRPGTIRPRAERVAIGVVSTVLVVAVLPPAAADRVRPAALPANEGTSASASSCPSVQVFVRRVHLG